MPPNNNEILKVQASVFEADQTGIDAQDLLAYIARNASFFREFAEHLPESKWKEFQEAAQSGNTSNVRNILEDYRSFRNAQEEQLEHDDPEAFEELLDALEHASTDPEKWAEALRIIDTQLETHAEAREEAKPYPLHPGAEQRPEMPY